MSNQAYIFGIFILNGFIIGILFDMFRSFRKILKTPDFITYIHDILFWALTGGILTYSIFKFNNGKLRSYIFLGVILGILVYMLIFSKIFLKINTNILNLIKNMIIFTIIKPVIYIYNFVKKLVFKSVRFIFINLKKTIQKCKKLQLYAKKSKYKKDLQ